MRAKKSIKKSVFILIIMSVILLPAMTATAHPGRTDSEGGHIDSKTGTYHYHNADKTNQNTKYEVDYYTNGIMIIITCTAVAGGVSIFMSVCINYILKRKPYANRKKPDPEHHRVREHYVVHEGKLRRKHIR